MKNLDDIRKLTLELTDISIPVEFLPESGSRVGAYKRVDYVWCPSRKCDPTESHLRSLVLYTSGVGRRRDVILRIAANRARLFEDEWLSTRWSDFSRTEHEFDIRGAKFKFYIIQGEELEGDTIDDVDEENAILFGNSGQQAKEQPDQEPELDQNSSWSDEEETTVLKTVRIAGIFPGKEAEVWLEIRLPAEDYQEEIILGMLRSIR